MSDVMLAMAATKDKLESKRKQERTTMVQARIRTAGAFVGKPPFGYRSRARSTPGIWSRPTRAAADPRGVPAVHRTGRASPRSARGWRRRPAASGGPGACHGTLRNPVYRGVQEDDEGRPIHRCEALVDASIWKRRQRCPRPARASAARRTSSTPPLLSGVLVRPMRGEWRLQPDVPAPIQQEGPLPGVLPLHRHGYAAQGLREHDPADHSGRAREHVHEGARAGPRYQGIWFIEPGTDHAAELEEVKFEIRSLATMELTDEEYDARLVELRAERDRLAALPVIPDRLVEKSTGETYGPSGGGSAPERGAWLRQRGLKVRAVKEERRHHVVILDAQGNELIEYRSPEPIVRGAPGWSMDDAGALAE